MTYGRKDLAVQVGIQKAKGYTMKEISALEARIKNIEYYTVLNALALDTQTTSVINTGTQLERFKNGIFADPFNDSSISRVEDAEFNMAVSSSKSIARPNVNQVFPGFALDTASSTNIQSSGKILTLDYTNVNIGGNPYASIYRNSAETFYSFRGALSLFPSYDGTNVGINAAPQTISVDVAGGFVAAAAAGSFQDIDTLQGAPAIVSEAGLTNYWNSTVSQTITDISVQTQTITQDVGQYVTSVSQLEYMSTKTIAIIGKGLRPNTKVYAYFDSKTVSAYCVPATPASAYALSNGSLNPATLASINTLANPAVILRQTGALGSQLTTNSLGEVYLLFFLPANTFRAGERIFTIADINASTFVSEITTSAEGVYKSSALSVTTQQVGFSIIQPVFTPSTVTNVLPPLAWTTQDQLPDINNYITNNITNVTNINTNNGGNNGNNNNNGGSGCCFDPDALVTMADGSLKKICKIQIGDLVADGTDGINTVIGIEAPVLGNRLMYSFNGNWAFVSEEHPIMTSEGWGSFDPDSWAVEAEFIGRLVKIDIGSEILKSDGTYETVEYIDHKILPEDYVIYNLLLDGDHMYNVQGYVVHNKKSDFDSLALDSNGNFGGLTNGQIAGGQGSTSGNGSPGNGGGEYTGHGGGGRFCGIF